ncbi:hypothetical protein M758_7G007800 [Ceratodon purpureus]|nr:hypothetical protein M758_7G007800 [Ceratodon purpureus]
MVVDMELDSVQQPELGEKALRQRDVVRIGCGAGFAGDRPNAARRLLLEVPDMQYLVLECLAERTLSTRYEAMVAGGKGYDPRISDWMRVLLPDAVRLGVRLITNMGAVDPLGAQEEVMELAAELGLSITVAVAYEVLEVDTARSHPSDSKHGVGGHSTYLGAAPLVDALRTSKPDVLITSRVADAALFLAPMVYELGWKWEDWEYLAQGTLAGHLLECGCQLTGGYFMHPADPQRSFSAEQLYHASLPYADVTWDGGVILGKEENSGGELSVATCTQQLLYEIGDPAGYITPDVIVNFSNVTFEPLSTDRVVAKGAEPAAHSAPDELLRLVPKHCGWKGWGEVSYGGSSCMERAAAADYLVRAWLEETYHGLSSCILSYHVGQDSLQIYASHELALAKPVANEVRLRMDGLFETQKQASKFVQEFEALYTNGPAGGGGIRTGLNHELLLHKSLVPREQVQWKTYSREGPRRLEDIPPASETHSKAGMSAPVRSNIPLANVVSPAPSGVELPLYKVAHGRTGDKGNQLNVSIIPHCRTDLARLQRIINPGWVGEVMKHLLTNYPRVSAHMMQELRLSKLRKNEDSSRSMIMLESVVDVYEVSGVAALNIVVKDVLDGGVTCSRRLDRHGKSLSDLILSQVVILSD